MFLRRHISLWISGRIETPTSPKRTFLSSNLVVRNCPPTSPLPSGISSLNATQTGPSLKRRQDGIHIAEGDETGAGAAARTKRTGFLGQMTARERKITSFSASPPFQTRFFEGERAIK